MFSYCSSLARQDLWGVDRQCVVFLNQWTKDLKVFKILVTSYKIHTLFLYQLSKFPNTGPGALETSKLAQVAPTIGQNTNQFRGRTRFEEEIVACYVPVLKSTNCYALGNSQILFNFETWFPSSQSALSGRPPPAQQHNDTMEKIFSKLQSSIMRVKLTPTHRMLNFMTFFRVTKSEFITFNPLLRIGWENPALNTFYRQLDKL